MWNHHSTRVMEAASTSVSFTMLSFLSNAFSFFYYAVFSLKCFHVLSRENLHVSIISKIDHAGH